MQQIVDAQQIWRYKSPQGNNTELYLITQPESQRNVMINSIAIICYIYELEEII